MTARIVLVGADAIGHGDALAAAIGATHVLAPAGGSEMEAALAGSLDGFVLEGYPLNVTQAERLDAFLDARAASIDLALWFRAADAATPADDELLAHYRGRVVEVDVSDRPSEPDLNARALDAVREATVSLVG